MSIIIYSNANETVSNRMANYTSSFLTRRPGLNLRFGSAIWHILLIRA